MSQEFEEVKQAIKEDLDKWVKNAKEEILNQFGVDALFKAQARLNQQAEEMVGRLKQSIDKMSVAFPHDWMWAFKQGCFPVVTPPFKMDERYGTRVDIDLPVIGRMIIYGESYGANRLPPGIYKLAIVPLKIDEEELTSEEISKLR